MKKKIGFSILAIFSLLISTLPTSYAVPTVSIYTEKEIYSYGDTLSFTIEVSEVTGESAILHIIDETGKSSTAIPIPITELKTVLPSPYPFESAVYPLGRYTLDIEYSGVSTTTEFELIDSGKIVIPVWIKDLSRYWYNGAISDLEFSQGIGFLIKEGIIIVPETENQGTESEIKIPDWIKTNTKWWLDGKISDAEFAQGIQYLLKVGIIVV